MVDLRNDGRGMLLQLRPGDHYVDEMGAMCVVDRIIDDCVVVSRSVAEQ